MRKPHRSATERIEDAFADLSIKDQEFVLRMCQSLHRQACRARPVPSAATNGDTEKQRKLGEDVE